MRTSIALALLVLGAPLLGCDGRDPAPLVPLTDAEAADGRPVSPPIGSGGDGGGQPDDVLLDDTGLGEDDAGTIDDGGALDDGGGLLDMDGGGGVLDMDGGDPFA